MCQKVIRATNKTTGKEGQGEFELMEVGVQSCGTEKVTFELIFKVVIVCLLDIWGNCYRHAGKVENILDIMKEQQNQ